MNFDEFEEKLQRQPRREIPPEWRREILGQLRQKTESATPWWRQLLWPHPAAWASIAAAWIAIFALNHASLPEEAPRHTASNPVQDRAWAYEERKRLWAEFVQDTSPALFQRVPDVDRPRSFRVLDWQAV
jgi:hypothetical protein